MAQNADEFIAAATAVAEGKTPEGSVTSINTEPPEPPAPKPEGEEPPTRMPDPDPELDEAARELEAGEEKAPEEKAPEKKEEPKKSLVDIAKEKAEARKAAKADAATQEKLTKAERLLAAAEKGDAMALLAAAGVSWSKAAKQVLEGHGATEDEAEESEAPAAKSVPSKLEQEVAELKRELAERREREARQTAMTAVKDAIAADPERFKLVGARKAETKALQYIERYYAETGELPGETFEQSIEIGLEATEIELRKELESWKPLLSSASGTTNPGKRAVPDEAVRNQASKTLTNANGAHPRPAAKTSPQPLTDDDYIAAATALMEQRQ